jgi:hypothetical protein
MNHLLRFVSLMCFLLQGIWLHGQGTIVEHPIFPNDFLGIYEGTLHVSNTKGNSKLPMEFHLLKTASPDTFVYKIVYVVDSVPQSRDYYLLSVNPDKGEFLIDENNGILLDAKYVDSTLYSIFEVEGNLLTSGLRFYKDFIDFELTFSKMNTKRASGGDDDDTPLVVSYPVSVIQKARLYLMDN